MKTPATISHRISGRLRVRVPARCGDEAFFHELAEELILAEGIEGVQANPDTASLLLLYTPGQVDIDALLGTFFQFEAEDARAGESSSLAALPAQDWLNPMRRFCAEPNSLQASTALLLIAYGVWQLSQGRRVGPGWFNAFWVAFNLLAIRR